MAIGICKKPIEDFQSIDDQPVNLLFMIAAAYNQHSYYLKTISNFSVKFKNEELRKQILNSSSALEVYNLLLNSK